MNFGRLNELTLAQDKMIQLFIAKYLLDNGLLNAPAPDAPLIQASTSLGGAGGGVKADV